jgi:hypothetical protein
VSTTEELLDRKVAVPVHKNEKNTAKEIDRVFGLVVRVLG